MKSERKEVVAMMRVLDLFCGVGGAGFGIRRALDEMGLSHLYVGVDIDRQVLRAHRRINPGADLILADAYRLPDEFITQFDFIWASPPCETHSVLRFHRRRNQRKDKPDMRLWDLIRRLRRLGVPHIVENVKPFYGPVLKPTLIVWRHCFWSNIPLQPVKFSPESRWYEMHNRKRELLDFLGLPRRCWNFVTREMLRDCTHPEIAYALFKQFLCKQNSKHYFPDAARIPIHFAGWGGKQIKNNGGGLIEDS